MRRTILRITGCVVLLVISSDLNAAQLVGGTAGVFGSGFPFSIVSVNPATGQLAPLSPAISNHYFSGLDVAPDDTLYGVAQDLFRIDRASGNVTQIGPLSLNGGPPILMAAMAISPTGKMFAVGNSTNTLYTVDINSGALTAVGAINLVRGLAFTPDGSLYGGFANLFKIDPTNAQILADLGRYGDSQTFVCELDYHNGSLLGVWPFQGSGTSTMKSTLYSINLAGTAGQLATKLTDINYDLVSIATVPEPSSQMLVALAAICLGASRVRRRESAGAAAG